MTDIVNYVFRCTYVIQVFMKRYVSNCVTEKIALQNQTHDLTTLWQRHADNIERHLLDKKRSKNHSLKLFRI